MVQALTPAGKDADRVHPDLSKKPNRFVEKNQLLFLAGQLAEAKIAKANAGKVVDAIRKQMKNAGQGMKAFDTFMSVAEKGDVTAVLKMVDEIMYLAEVFALVPKGTQVDFFKGPSSAEDVLKKAYDMGYVRSLLGQSPDEQAYPNNSDVGQEHLKGWHDGQEVRQREFVDHNERMAKAAAERKAAADKKAADAEQKAKDEAEKAAKSEKKDGGGETTTDAGNELEPAE